MALFYLMLIMFILLHWLLYGLFSAKSWKCQVITFEINSQSFKCTPHTFAAKPETLFHWRDKWRETSALIAWKTVRHFLSTTPWLKIQVLSEGFLCLVWVFFSFSPHYSWKSPLVIICFLIVCFYIKSLKGWRHSLRYLIYSFCSI